MKHIHFDGSIGQKNYSQLYAQLSQEISDEDSLQQLQTALNHVIEVSEDPDPRPSSLEVALTLKHLGVNIQILIAALLSDPRLREKLDILAVEQEYGKTIASLVSQVNWLNTFKECTNAETDVPEEAEALRRLLLASIDDVRAVLIKLAFRVQRLRGLKQEPKPIQLCIAKETMDIYTPLANRLGIAELKWEMEDLAFRYLQPQAYKQLAKSMDDKRSDREKYINEFVNKLQVHIDKAGIKAKPYGRPKHLYSIHKKMQKKSVQLHELADLLAVRIIVNSLSDCYLVLGIVHNLWKHLPHEFDDYIANPKENGYQSIHTAIIGAENRVVEIQIRTREMHEFSEHGVAAHWRYKEGSEQDLALERSITVLRKLLENREADDDLLLEEFKTDFFSDRVMVLTPKKEVIDLPKGATALDFAYSIHTEVGHHCSGAIVNGERVPLSYPLKSGECIDILNDPQSTPHLQWLDQKKNFVKTLKAKSRIRQWFNALYLDENKKPVVSSKNLQGIGNHKASTASCCKPQIGDQIVGVLLSDQSILIHRFDCSKIDQNGEYQINLSWGEDQPGERLTIHISAFDRQGLLQDITTLLSQSRINVLKANTETDVIDQSVTMELTIEFGIDTDIDLVLKRISRIANVFNAVKLS